MKSEKPNLKGRTLKRSEIKNVFQVTKFVPTSKRYLNRQPHESIRDAIERAQKMEWWSQVVVKKPNFNARFWWWSLDASEAHPHRSHEHFDEEGLLDADHDDRHRIE